MCIEKVYFARVLGRPDSPYRGAIQATRAGRPVSLRFRWPGRFDPVEACLRSPVPGFLEEGFNPRWLPSGGHRSGPRLPHHHSVY